MKTDYWFQWYFRELPEVVFRHVDLPTARPEQFEFESPELKEVSLRMDGVYRPLVADQVYIFVEAQLYPDKTFYQAWLAKIFLYLHQHEAEQDFHALAIFGSRAHEPRRVPSTIRALQRTGELHCIYLDELQDPLTTSVELAIMQLAVASLSELPRRARDLVAYCKEQSGEAEADSKLLTLIELIVIANFPAFSYEEIQEMLNLSDIRETRFYKEVINKGREEGLEKGREEGREKGREEGQAGAIAKLHEKGMSVREIAELLDLQQKTVRALLKRSAKK